MKMKRWRLLFNALSARVHENRYYPDISGVAKSYNFYPIAPQKLTDGIASVALGLGKWVVEGGNGSFLSEISEGYYAVFFCEGNIEYIAKIIFLVGP